LESNCVLGVAVSGVCAGAAAAPVIGVTRGTGRSSCASPVVGEIEAGIRSWSNASMARTRGSE
jgi:hypothetical protein